MASFVDDEEEIDAYYVFTPLVESVVNAFCATGPGGGVDPTCSPGGAAKGDIHGQLEKSGAFGDAKLKRLIAMNPEGPKDGQYVVHKTMSKEQKDALSKVLPPGTKLVPVGSEPKEKPEVEVTATTTTAPQQEAQQGGTYASSQGKFHVLHSDNKHFEAEFAAAGRKFTVEVAKKSGEWDVTFFPSGANNFTMKQTGELGVAAVPVLMNVGATVDHFVRERQPDTFKFSAFLKEESRVRLYDRVSQLIARRHGYSLDRKEDAGYMLYKFAKGVQNAAQASFYEDFLDLYGDELTYEERMELESWL